MPQTGRPLWAFEIDLTGSNCGPGWYSVACVCAWDAVDLDGLREAAAKRYAVPLEQVSEPVACWACVGCGSTDGRYDDGDACEECVMNSFAEMG